MVVGVWRVGCPLLWKLVTHGSFHNTLERLQNVLEHHSMMILESCHCCSIRDEEIGGVQYTTSSAPDVICSTVCDMVPAVRCRWFHCRQR